MFGVALCVTWCSNVTLFWQGLQNEFLTKMCRKVVPRELEEHDRCCCEQKCEQSIQRFPKKTRSCDVTWTGPVEL